jgi:phosphoribulokinase
MMYSERIISSLATSIVSVDHRPVLVGIDGHGGSGKSTLARELAKDIPLIVAIVEGDDFYSDMPENVKALLTPEEGCEEYFDWRRLRSEVLDGMRERSPILRYQQYDWDAAAMGAWIEMPTPEVIIVEGVYTLRAELRNYFDVSVFVRTSESARLQRLVARGENSDLWIRRWDAASDFYVSREKSWEWVDVLLDGE